MGNEILTQLMHSQKPLVIIIIHCALHDRSSTVDFFHQIGQPI